MAVITNNEVYQYSTTNLRKNRAANLNLKELDLFAELELELEKSPS